MYLKVPTLVSFKSDAPNCSFLSSASSAPGASPLTDLNSLVTLAGARTIELGVRVAAQIYVLFEQTLTSHRLIERFYT